MRPSVLVVDDDQDIRMIVRLHFSWDGWIVAEASSAETAIDIVEELEPDVVVLDDYFGTGRRGSDAALDLKQRSPSSHIVMFTVNPVPKRQIAGVDEVFSKAVAIADLVRTVTPFRSRTS